MRRAIIALLTATALMLTGLIPGPLRVTALGETSVTLNCTDGTSLTLLADTETLAGLTAAVQAMIDYPAGLNCTIVQNPLPLTTFFGNLALAANPNTMVVAGGRWQVGCSSIFSYRGTTSVPGGIVASGGKRPALASLISAAPATDCLDPHGCVWVNIGVNLHYRDKTSILEGTLNETMPENQTCPDPADPTATIAVGPSHFVSKPDPGCLFVTTNAMNKPQAAVRTTVTQVSGLQTASGTSVGFKVTEGETINSSFLDNLNSPSQQTPDEERDHLNAPPAADDSACVSSTPPTGFGGTQDNVLQNGNINIYPRP
jgi:hypothetical protein